MTESPPEPTGAAPARKMLVRTVELTTPDGVLRGRVGVETGAMRLADLVPTAYELTGVLLGQATQREEKAGHHISCGAGCGACCRHMVPLSPPEAFFLTDLIESFSPLRRFTLMAKFDSVVGTLDEKKMTNQLLDPALIDGSILAVAREYFGLGLACPFLVDESCSIHNHRPVACREFNVTSPAAWCKTPYERDVAKLPMPVPLSAPLARLTAELTDSKPCLIPLTLVPRWVSAHASLRYRTWPGPELFDRFMAQVAPSSPQVPSSDG